MTAMKSLATIVAALASVAHAENLPPTTTTPATPAAPVATILPPAPAPTVLPPIASAGQAILRTGTEVPLRTSEGLTTKNKALRTGQRFRLSVAEDVKVSGQTVIPVGSPAMGEITDVRNKGMWGKSGHFTAQLLYVQVNGRQIRLSGTFDDKGVTGTAMVVTSVVLVPLAGFFTTGTSANIPAGSSVKGFVDEDVPLAFASTAPAALVVSVPAQPMTVPVATPPAGTTAQPAAQRVTVAASAAVAQPAVAQPAPNQPVATAVVH